MKKTTIGQKLADKLSSFVGSWPFIICFNLVMIMWISINVSGVGHFDPYPFILLNLVLSTVAAVQAPLIMMSQNRQAEIDRVKFEEDRAINLQAKQDIEIVKKQLTAVIGANLFQYAELKDISETLDDIEDAVSEDE